MRRNGRDIDVLTEVVKGAVAGAVGVWAMDQVGWYMYNREAPEVLQREQEARVEEMDPAHVAANRVADAVGTTLTPRQPHPAGIGVHYGLGVMPAMLYGPLRHRVEGLDAGHGLLYGLGLFLAMDEIVAPALGLAAGPTEYPWQAHARGLVSHLVLGVVTHATLELLERAT